VNSKLIEQLRRDEGEVLHAYDDHLGFATIGVGRLIDKRKGGGISAQESAYLLSNDVARVDAELRSRLPWFGQLDEVRQAALLNMGFQLGIAGLMEFTRSLACIRDGRFAEAETHLLQSKWATQTPARAKRVAHQIFTGEWQ
jgi:lysozyme